MSGTIALVGGGPSALVAAIALARRGTSPIGAGLMEAQNLLEPDRKIEVVREEERKRDLLVDIHEEADDKR